jgi:hypothetical protein
VGCDISPLMANDSMSDVGTTLASWSGGKRVDDYLDAISFHSYRTNYSDMCARVKQQIYANNFDGSIENILVGEIGDDSFALTNAQGRAEHAMDCARKIIGYSKQGAYTVLRWWYNGANEWGATDNAGLNPVPQHFNPVKLYCNTLPKVSYDYYIKQTDVLSSSPYAGSFFDSVCISFWDPVASRNKIAIWLVNNSVYESRSVRVNFANLTSNKTFRKKLIVTSSHFNYQCDIQDYGIVGTATPGTPYIDDGLWGRCIQVYVEE